ncbi:uncharacterized protein LOC126969880 isoform X2 [Leptidea sinapis]|nr:uncharacterized protein LOC126969880 isoform X2 [Leptidea sinapis]
MYNKESHFQPLSGRRIIDINYFLQKFQEKARHNDLFDCKSSNFCLVGERRHGLISIFKFECNMCKEICSISSENTKDTEHVDANIAATTGVVACGIGFSQFEELFSAINIPIFSTKFFNQMQNKLYKKWEETACETMEAAANKEKEIAIADGRTKNGYAVIDVYVDGAWCARSYGSHYKASSGAAAIIGRNTGEVLYFGVRNKYCLVCARAENKKTASQDHLCFKNFQGSSSSMEADIIVEGFKSSISMYGIIYGRMVGDGDSSTYSKILISNPYESQNLTVEKLECRNHILRNFCKKLRAVTTETKYILAHRKTLTNQKIMTMRKAIVKSITHHKASQSPKNVAISILHNDIINSLSHAYGNHQLCQNYFCDKDKNCGGELLKIENSTFIFRINAIVSNVASKSRSLIEDVNTNTVECFNSVIAILTGGKRINFALKGGYQGRCAAAVVSFNTKSAVSTIQKAITSNAPGGLAEEIEKRRAKKRKLNMEHPVKKRRVLKDLNKMQHDYGPACSLPDMSQKEYDKSKEHFLKNLETLTSDRHKVERSTILQRDSSEWLEIRKNIIIASNFGPICKRKDTLDTAPLVKNLLYKKNLAHLTSIAHGVEHEQQALLQLQQQENIIIEPCGLFIDKEYPFIGATPDGLIGEDTIVEVKCPITAHKKGLSNCIQENKIEILKYNINTKTATVNKNSNWYYQIQGQLHVSERQQCLLAIWAGENENVYIKFIEKDDLFWETKMKPKLIKFYMKCLLPEIIDSRNVRGMPIRNLSMQDNNENIPPNDQDENENVDPDESQPRQSTRQLNVNDF